MKVEKRPKFTNRLVQKVSTKDVNLCPFHFKSWFSFFQDLMCLNHNVHAFEK